MNKSQMRIGLGFVTGLIIVLAIMLPLLSPDESRKPKVLTRGQIKSLAFFLNEYNKSNGHLPFGDNSNIAATLSAVFTNGFLNDPAWTNSNGELVDCWQVPFQLQIAGTTNFIIRSAGPDKKFGDADDIIFNSISNDFVKP